MPQPPRALGRHRTSGFSELQDEYTRGSAVRIARVLSLTGMAVTGRTVSALIIAGENLFTTIDDRIVTMDHGKVGDRRSPARS